MELFIAALQTKNHLKKQFQLLTEVAVQIFGQQSKPENDYIERVSGNQAYLDICKKLYVNPLNSNDVIAYIFYARTEIPPKLRASIMVAMGATGNFSNGNLKSFAQNNGLPLPQIRSGPKRIADKKWFEGWEKRVLNQRAVQR